MPPLLGRLFSTIHKALELRHICRFLALCGGFWSSSSSAKKTHHQCCVFKGFKMIKEKALTFIDLVIWIELQKHCIAC